MPGCVRVFAAYVEEFLDSENELNGGILANLSYGPQGIWISHAIVPDHEDDFSDIPATTADTAWLSRLSQKDVIDTLLLSIERNVSSSTTEYIAALPALSALLDHEMELLDTDLAREQIEVEIQPGNWSKARLEALSDPNSSAIRSSAHIESVMKNCLSMLKGKYDPEVERQQVKNLARDLCNQLIEIMPLSTRMRDLCQGADRATMKENAI